MITKTENILRPIIVSACKSFESDMEKKYGIHVRMRVSSGASNTISMVQVHCNIWPTKQARRQILGSSKWKITMYSWTIDGRNKHLSTSNCYQKIALMMMTTCMESIYDDTLLFLRAQSGPDDNKWGMVPTTKEAAYAKD